MNIIQNIYFSLPELFFCTRRCSRYDIFLDILEACRKEQNISSILQRCRLCGKQKEILVHLNHSGLSKKEGNFYKTTDEGHIFLREFEKLLEKLKIWNSYPSHDTLANLSCLEQNTSP